MIGYTVSESQVEAYALRYASALLQGDVAELDAIVKRVREMHIFNAVIVLAEAKVREVLH